MYQIEIQKTIDRLQKELPNLAILYPGHSWESVSGADSFAVILCENGQYFGGQVLQVLKVFGSFGCTPRYFLQLFKESLGEFSTLDEVIDYIHKMGQAFSIAPKEQE